MSLIILRVKLFSVNSSGNTSHFFSDPSGTDCSVQRILTCCPRPVLRSRSCIFALVQRTTTTVTQCRRHKNDKFCDDCQHTIIDLNLPLNLKNLLLVLSQLQSVDIFHFFVPKDLLLDYCSDL